MKYPKIETLYDRDPQTFKVIPTQLRCPEFEIINRWYVTEKIDGTNVRIMWNHTEQYLTFGGRTDNAQMPTTLVNYLRSTFTPEQFTGFDSDMILFGEGYGAGIQKGGGYRKDVSFRLFDVKIGEWWLEPEGIIDIGFQMGCKAVPSLNVINTLPKTLDELWLLTGNNSMVAAEDSGTGCRPEGVVARSHPLLLTRSGQRVMWKLKYKDF